MGEGRFLSPLSVHIHLWGWETLTWDALKTLGSERSEGNDRLFRDLERSLQCSCRTQERRMASCPAASSSCGRCRRERKTAWLAKATRGHQYGIILVNCHVSSRERFPVIKL